MIIKIQPQELENNTLPYPYFVDKDGMVGRQDWWRGKPYKLLGFSKKPVAGKIDLLFKNFIKKHKKAVGMYTVFANKNDEWITQTVPVDSVKILKQ